jgi:hypothetical protein
MGVPPVAFYLRGLAFCSLAVVQKVRDVLPISARLCDLGRHVSKTETQRLEFADRIALLKVGSRTLASFLALTVS